MEQQGLKEKNNYLGLNQKSLTLMDELIRKLHYIPALLKDGHIITLGGAGIGKTTTLLNSTNKIKNITNSSSANLFGNMQTDKDGCATSSVISA